MLKAIEYVRAFPLGKAKIVELTYKSENVVAKRIYDALGFVETGEILSCGEVRAKLVL
ncbi:hypothetical protein [Paenibacillus spongiae]|uniref:GNAT family N-acetyltransferase n=1 Tax=Paenibacillus spongiae TaxID=2909671 RepID=A0ABY5SLI1_9BACL|nr:hypothetical protein [Paenibacillus spongiae]UVI33103.1 hypothetical protein L1F29_15225 [Paenibacillus spongiae]